METACRTATVVLLGVASAVLTAAHAVAVTTAFPCTSPSRLELVLPHVPDDAPTQIAVNGATIVAGPFSDVRSTALPAPADGVRTVNVDVRVVDPQVRKRNLYVASISCSVLESAPEPLRGAARPPARLVIGLDGAAVLPLGQTAAGADGWDPIGRPESAFTSAVTGDGVVASVAVADATGVPLIAGARGIEAVLTINNGTASPIRVLHTALSLSCGGKRMPAALSVFPLSPRPRIVAPGDSARQRFRLDTFDDTPCGDVAVEPLAVFAPVGSDLLAGADPGEGPEAAAPWETGLSRHEGAALAPLTASLDAIGAFARKVADWRAYSEVAFTPPTGVNVSGSAYGTLTLPAAASAPLPVLQSAPIPLAGLPEGGLALGCASWSGEGASLELLDETGATIAAVQRNLSGFWWRDAVANWTERLLTLPPTPGATAVRVTLNARSAASWWDNLYLVPLDTVRRASAQAMPLSITPPPIADRGIAYIGEDRDTQGDWVGRYGAYCYILAAMSAPRDMVGGELEPVKCKHLDFSQKYPNEVIRVRGEGEFRYASWTTNPGDALTRHWIGAMRTDERRALENPQWGARTHASWDDHGELHPTDAWGPDLLIRLRMPAGLWRLSLYFLDYDWFNAPFPRDHRIEIGELDREPECFARVADSGDGVYKAFAVQGGRDILLRIRKDRSAAVLTSGIFLDPLANPELHVLGTKVTGELQERIKRLDESERTDFGAQLRVLDLAEAVEQVATADVGALADPATQRLRFELWTRAFGQCPRQDGAFDAYVGALTRGSSPERAIAHLQREAAAYFAEGMLDPAERCHDAALELMQAASDGVKVADAHKDVALQFRVEHPQYARRHLDECLARSAATLPPEQQVAYVRAAAAQLFAVASADYKRGRGLVRLPYGLAETAYNRLVDAVGYDRLSPEERMNLMLCLERQTWYTLGWERLAAEQERLIESIPAEQVTGGLLTDLIRSYAVLAQTDPAYVDKAADVAQRLRGQLPDGDWRLDACFRMAQICYTAKQNDRASEFCREVMTSWPGTPEATEAKRLLDLMKPK